MGSLPKSNIKASATLRRVHPASHTGQVDCPAGPGAGRQKPCGGWHFLLMKDGLELYHRIANFDGATLGHPGQHADRSQVFDRLALG